MDLYFTMGLYGCEKHKPVTNKLPQPSYLHLQLVPPLTPLRNVLGKKQPTPSASASQFGSLECFSFTARHGLDVEHTVIDHDKHAGYHGLTNNLSSVSRG